jgi:hypothetical protein
MLKALAAFVGYRSTEWLNVGCFFGLFVEVLVIPNSATFQYMSGSGRSYGLAIIFLLTSYLRALALILNGRSYYYGPYLRAIGALVGAVLWTLLSVSLARIIFDHQYLSEPISIPIYVALALSELLTVYRAAGDVMPGRGDHGRKSA